MPATAIPPKSPEIIALDKDLHLATRTMKKAPPAERPEWKHLIDGLLDRRLELMRRPKS